MEKSVFCLFKLDPKKTRNNTASKFRGVSREGSLWRAKITHATKVYSLGNYKTELEAARAYDKKCQEFARYHHMNFPPQNPAETEQSTFHSQIFSSKNTPRLFISYRAKQHGT